MSGFYRLRVRRRHDDPVRSGIPRWRVARMNDLRSLPIRRRGLQAHTPWFVFQIRPPKWGGPR